MRKRSQYGSYPTSPFVPPVIMEPGHRFITTPWRLDQPGPLPDQSTSEVVYLADWFMDEIKETVSHNRRGNQLLFDGRVVSTIIPALGKHSPPPPPPL